MESLWGQGREKKLKNISETNRSFGFPNILPPL
jgi:hypothetical protein